MSITFATNPRRCTGYRFDPDLERPRDDGYTLGGLHVLRHLERLLAPHDLSLVLTDATGYARHAELLRGYDCDVAEQELRRYRALNSESSVRRLLRDEPQSVPVFTLTVGGCTGWKNFSWEGIRLDRYLQPGQLFAVYLHRYPYFGPQVRRIPQFLHLAQWQAPFPTESLYTWTNGARCKIAPQTIAHRKELAYLFHTGQPASYGDRSWLDQHRWWDHVTGEAPLRLVSTRR